MHQYFVFSDAETLHPGTVYEAENALTNLEFHDQLAEPEIGGNTSDLGAGSHVPNYNGLADHQRHQQKSIDQTRPNSHAFPTGACHALHHELKLQRTRTVNVNYTSINHQAVLEQPAGSSQPSKENHVNPKKLAKQRSDLKCRQKKKEEEKDLKRKVDVLMESGAKSKERNEYLENECASLKKDNARLEKALKKCKRDVCQLKDQHFGQSTTITEMSNALAESNYIGVQRENELLRANMNLLMKQMKNPNSLNEIQLQARIAQLEREKRALQLVIDALCAKMKWDLDDEPEYER